MSNKSKSPEITRLLGFMRAKNVKAADLAASLDMPERTLTNFIWNNRPLSGTVLRKLAAVHGVSIDWLIAGTGQMYSTDAVSHDAGNDLDDEPLEPLIPFFETIDAKDFADYWWLVARATEQSLMQSGATPGRDYSLLDLYQLAQPFVLERMRAPGLDVKTAENF